MNTRGDFDYFGIDLDGLVQSGMTVEWRSFVFGDLGHVNGNFRSVKYPETWFGLKIGDLHFRILKFRLIYVVLSHLGHVGLDWHSVQCLVLFQLQSCAQTGRFCLKTVRGGNPAS